VREELAEARAAIARANEEARRAREEAAQTLAEAKARVVAFLTQAQVEAARPDGKTPTPPAPATKLFLVAPPTILIARPELARALQQRLAGNPSITVFSTHDSLRALERILDVPPKVIGLDPAFATTSRGAALVARVKADPALAGVELRVLYQEDDGELPVLQSDCETLTDVDPIRATRPLDRWGTRQAARVPINSDVTARLNGEPVTLVDLSVAGAQIVSVRRLQPQRPVRVVLLDEGVELPLNGVVAWAVAERGGASVNYRAGVAFTEPDPHTLESYCRRYRLSDQHINTTATLA
jgi:hypothetical protein